MKKSKHPLFFLAGLSFVILMLLISFQVQTAKVAGIWNMFVETSQGSGNPVLVLKHVNDSIITGTYSGQFGEAHLRGTVKANNIYIQISVSELTMEYIGTVDGNNMKGKVIFGEYGEGTFTGKRKEN